MKRTSFWFCQYSHRNRSFCLTLHPSHLSSLDRSIPCWFGIAVIAPFRLKRIAHYFSPDFRYPLNPTRVGRVAVNLAIILLCIKISFVRLWWKIAVFEQPSLPSAYRVLLVHNHFLNTVLPGSQQDTGSKTAFSTSSSPLSSSWCSSEHFP